MREPPRVVRVSGSLAEARPMEEASLYELARVGRRGLLGEVVRVAGALGTLQVYEDTTGLEVGEPVTAMGRPLVARLGPGLLGSVLDGIGRPLDRMAAAAGAFVRPGVDVATLDADRPWAFEAAQAPGARVEGGDVLGTVEERPGFLHRVLVPPGVSGCVAELASGEFGVEDAVGSLEDGTPLRLAHDWPMRVPRPASGRVRSDRPFLTGQRVLDFLFPVAEGGSVALPGGFGTGKTVVEQSLAKYGDADVVVYVGCGERGNEMAEVLTELPGLEDPRTGGSVMDRTVLVVNTSNMPVAARESSVFLGLTVAEYYRDMGYRVAVLADSISRWAEALREMGARLEDMPGEEGYPTYLGNRMGKLYERAGRVKAAGSPERTGAVTLIAAVSPPGGDLSEPVTQASLRVVGGLWALDAALAHERHFPAVDWETSYSLHVEGTAAWFAEHAGEDWAELRRATLELLQRDRELRDIAGLVGADALQDRERFLLEAARIFRDVALAQSAFDPEDAFSPLDKTHALVSACLDFHRAGVEALEAGVPLRVLEPAPVRRALVALRDAPPHEVGERAEAARSAIAAFGRGSR